MAHRLAVLVVLTSALLSPSRAGAQYVMENLGRGVVAVRASETTVYVGWRLLGTDPADIAFNVYRSTDGGAPSKLNAAPIDGDDGLRRRVGEPVADQRLHRAPGARRP